MHKMLVVGCGGSGAKTLSYMMDSLKSMLAERMPEQYPDATQVKLPKAWGFVSVDVPSTAESFTQLNSVPKAGGSYITCGQDSSYSAVDHTVTTQLLQKKNAQALSSWMIKEPDFVTVNIAQGAGQYRRVGRMLYLNKASEIKQKLESAYRQVSSAQDLVPINAVLSPQAEVPSEVHVLVVSSMAGGAGASMAIDVCEMLSDVTNPNNILLFAVTPDIFPNPVQNVEFSGTTPNSLAMLGEMVAAQYGAAGRHDDRLYQSLGVTTNFDQKSYPFRRLFPVGAHIGTEGHPIGGLSNISPNVVYRALARGLSGMMMDHDFYQDFYNYSCTNPTAPEPVVHDFAWGTKKENASWGSFGYAQLSTGRDRYAEYSAQRLARKAVEKMLEGHLDPEKSSNDETQLKELYEKRRRAMEERFFQILPGLQKDPLRDLENFVNSNPQLREPLERLASDNRQKLTARLSNLQEVKNAEWLGAAQIVLSDFGNVLNNDGEGTPVKRAVHTWVSKEFVQKRTVDLFIELARTFSAPFALYALNEFETYVATRSRYILEQSARTATTAAAWIPEQRLAQLQKGNDVANPAVKQQIISEIVNNATPQLSNASRILFARQLYPLLEDYVKTFLSPLRKAISDGIRQLRMDMDVSMDPTLGVAQMKTNVPQLWPTADNTEVPSRFSQAANELYLTSIDQFPDRFLEHVQDAVNDKELTVDASYNEAASQVLAGAWEVIGEEPRVGDLIVQDMVWVPEHAREMVDGKGGVVDQQDAHFVFKSAARDVLERSREFVGRHGYQFNRFISESLSDYVHDLNPAKRAHIVEQFRRALGAALPLAQLSDPLVLKIYGAPVKYKFSFSAIPFGNDPELVKQLNDVLKNDQQITLPGDGSEPLQNEITSHGKQRHIDIIGSYPTYAPIVYSSVMAPIAHHRSAAAGQGLDFWTDRRARPIPAAIAMGDAERRAMIAGWYIGLITGRVIAPMTLDQQTQNWVFVERGNTRRETDLPKPLLTNVHGMRHPKLDWLPVVLESYNLAVAKCCTTQSLEPLGSYVALRQLYDSSLSQPSTEGMTFRGEELLREWLEDGKPKCGEENTPVSQLYGAWEWTKEERYEKAKHWLESHRKVAERWKPTAADDFQAMLGRQEGTITSREQAYKLPLFVDLAEDIVIMLDRVLELLEKAKKPARQMNQNSAGYASSSSSANIIPDDLEDEL